MSQPIAPRSSVEWFAKRMEVELRANDHKGGWDRMGLGEISTRVHQEAKELSRVLATFREQHATGFIPIETIHSIISEAADVANFAMMLADNARKLLPEGDPHA